MATANPREDQNVSKELVKTSNGDNQKQLWNYLTEGSLDHVELDLVSRMLDKWQEMGIENVQAVHDGTEVFGSRLESATTEILSASDVNPSFARLVLAKTRYLLRRKGSWNPKASRQGVANSARRQANAELVMA